VKDKKEKMKGWGIRKRSTGNDVKVGRKRERLKGRKKERKKEWKKERNTGAKKSGSMWHRSRKKNEGSDSKKRQMGLENKKGK
jgi:hypothetical protein